MNNAHHNIKSEVIHLPMVMAIQQMTTPIHIYVAGMAASIINPILPMRDQISKELYSARSQNIQAR